ncbi:Protein of unknown function [Cotesia congregata]|uniref:Uncharacterized protein n=1 Tax=Cotesia congregata TaxID=51543 RepID=A0A8J2HH99_COTCN|nr:Protein of unknown function [Cotesia congregata]
MRMARSSLSDPALAYQSIGPGSSPAYTNEYFQYLSVLYCSAQEIKRVPISKSLIVVILKSFFIIPIRGIFTLNYKKSLIVVTLKIIAGTLHTYALRNSRLKSELNAHTVLFKCEEATRKSIHSAGDSRALEPSSALSST